MRLVYTEPARQDLNQILEEIGRSFPAAYEGFARRLRMVEAQLRLWPRSAGRIDGVGLIDGKEELRMVPMVRYPFNIFYVIVSGRIEILHIHHAARDVVAFREGDS